MAQDRVHRRAGIVRRHPPAHQGKRRGRGGVQRAALRPLHDPLRRSQANLRRPVQKPVQPEAPAPGIVPACNKVHEPGAERRRYGAKHLAQESVQHVVVARRIVPQLVENRVEIVRKRRRLRHVSGIAENERGQALRRLQPGSGIGPGKGHRRIAVERPGRRQPLDGAAGLRQKTLAKAPPVLQVPPRIVHQNLEQQQPACRIRLPTHHQGKGEARRPKERRAEVPCQFLDGIRAPGGAELVEPGLDLCIIGHEPRVSALVGRRSMVARFVPPTKSAQVWVAKSAPVRSIAAQRHAPPMSSCCLRGLGAGDHRGARAPGPTSPRPRRRRWNRRNCAVRPRKGSHRHAGRRQPHVSHEATAWRRGPTRSG